MSKPDFIPLPSSKFKGWYEIPGYEKYLANEKGQIMSKKTRNYTYGGNAGRYLKVSVYRDGDERPNLRYVHDLIARAFYGLPEHPDTVVLHGDNNRRNNTKANLSWGSQSDNIKQVYRDGLKYSKQYGHLYPDRFKNRLAASTETGDLGYSLYLE